MPTVTVERRQRGPLGWIVAILFWGYNALMLVWLFYALVVIGDNMDIAVTEAERAGTAIGATIGLGMILGLWFFGAVILGIMMLFTRGKKVITTEER